MKVPDAVAQELLVDEHNVPLIETTLNAEWRSDPTMQFSGRLTLGAAVIVGRDVRIGREVLLDERWALIQASI